LILLFLNNLQVITFEIFSEWMNNIFVISPVNNHGGIMFIMSNQNIVIQKMSNQHDEYYFCEQPTIFLSSSLLSVWGKPNILPCFIF